MSTVWFPVFALSKEMDSDMMLGRPTTEKQKLIILIMSFQHVHVCIFTTTVVLAIETFIVS